MAKCMFSSDIVESDAFLDMPLTSQALYIHLNMNADNDGFVNPKRILRMVGANEDDMRILIAKKFILLFDSGIAVIKHWWINNTKRHDRHTPTTYQNELSELVQKTNKSYTKDTTQLALLTDDKNDVTTYRQPNADILAPQSNATQSNAKQFNATQSTATKPQNFDKSKKGTGAKVPDPKNYAKAVQRDNDLVRRELVARERKPTNTKSVGELFGGKA